MTKQFNETVQALRKEEIDLLLSLLSQREISEKTRAAIMARYEHGYSLALAGAFGGVSRQYVAKAEKKLMEMHEKIMAVYGNY